MPYGVVVHTNSEVQTLGSPLDAEMIESVTGMRSIATINLEQDLMVYIDDESFVNEDLKPNAVATFTVNNLGHDTDDYPGGWLCGSVVFAPQLGENGEPSEITDEQWSVLRSYIGF